MDHRQFQQHLREHGGYATPAGVDRSAADRLFGRLDAWYYAHLIGVVAEANRAAKRGSYTRDDFSKQSFDTLRLVERCGTKVTIENCDRLAESPWPRVLVANHMSLLETFILPGMILAYGDLSIVTRVKLLQYPLFGRVLQSVNPIAVTRANARADLITILGKGEEAIKAGRSVLVFPQSTRTPVFDPSTFNSIGAKLARRAGVGVMPVALKTDFMGIGRVLRDFGPVRRDRPVHVRFGPVFPVTGNGREANDRCLAFIVDSLREWGQDVRAAVAGTEASGDDNQ